MESLGDREFDVIVVGAGIMGSCAAYELSKLGQRTLLLEQFDFLHHRGSSHGESRTIRATYPEPYYPPLVLRAASLWDQAQSDAGYRVLTPTPHLDVGRSDNRVLRSLLENCKANGIGSRFLNQDELSQMFAGAFALPDGWTAVLTELGGVIKPTKAVAMFQSLAMKYGAVLRDRMEVIKIEKDEENGRGGVCVLTAGGDRFRGKKCVVTVGAWTKKLVKLVSGKDLPIQPLHTGLCYWKVKDRWEEKLTPEAGFPTFASYGEPFIYGTPTVEFPGLIKIALHGGSSCDPDKREWLPAEAEMVRAWIEKLMPESVETGEPVMRESCMYSITPDEDYVIDFLGGEFGEDVVVAGGFSGHGFKMAPAIGRMLAELAVEGKAAAAAEEIMHFRMGRFEEDQQRIARSI